MSANIRARILRLAQDTFGNPERGRYMWEDADAVLKWLGETEGLPPTPTTVQQVLMISTADPFVHSPAGFWDHADTRCLEPGAIGESPRWMPGEEAPRYDCVLRAIADGWKLLGAPERWNPISGNASWAWMLVREVTP